MPYFVDSHRRGVLGVEQRDMRGGTGRENGGESVTWIKISKYIFKKGNKKELPWPRCLFQAIETLAKIGIKAISS